MQKDTEISQGAFTLPGEAGYENLTLELASRWGADAIRDSDGTTLSDAIVSQNFDIYSTICLVRADNQWAKSHPDKWQQNYLMSFPKTAQGSQLEIDIMEGYFDQQFSVNPLEPERWWQVFDRTSSREVNSSDWDFHSDTGKVEVRNTTPWHEYTVNFLAFRKWEAISMYNHITNDWGDREHQIPVDPVYPETREHLLSFLEGWLKNHPQTDVVRFTSMFYNFAWFWGDHPRLRFVYSDWGSYDFTVSPLAMELFQQQKGYALCSEDFVNKGKYNATHNVPTARYRDWVDFMNGFVSDFGRQCIDLVHKHGKKAYVFYDDHWLGLEPYSPRFKDMGFDGLIKCVFNGFEARKCAGVEDVPVHELRLHPYLFPTGLSGEPTFKQGGNPKLDAQRFWANIRRALLRKPVDRIGLGGYLHLVEPFPDFIDYIEDLAGEFRKIKALHAKGAPWSSGIKVAVLTAWGSLRSWICSGHLHEHPEIYLTNLLESLAGLPVDVSFLSFEDILSKGIPEDVSVLLNAGRLNRAWSGGENWQNPDLVSRIAQWVARGGALLGVGEPSALSGASPYFQMASVLGVDRETGDSICRFKYDYQLAEKHFIIDGIDKNLDLGEITSSVFLRDLNTHVLLEKYGTPLLTAHDFSQGRAVYLGGFKYNHQNTRLLYRALCWASGKEDLCTYWQTDNVLTDAAYYPAKGELVLVNHSDQEQSCKLGSDSGREIKENLMPFELKIIKM